MKYVLISVGAGILTSLLVKKLNSPIVVYIGMEDLIEYIHYN